MNTPVPLDDERQLREDAFKVLTDIVQENYADGRRSYGASLKPELRRRTYDGFSEARLGFSGFREFLEAAENAGRISLHPAPKGPDREATPSGRPPLAVTAPNAGVARRVREDLWDAFVNWDTGWTRMYDRDTDRAFRFPRQPVPLEPARFRQVRTEVESGGERYIPIVPIPFDDQIKWMTQFVATEHDIGAQTRLNATLNDPKPVRAFTQALVALPAAKARWRILRNLEVQERIRAWATEHELTLDIFDQRGGDTAPPQTSDAAIAEPHERTGKVEELRTILHRAIDRMPEAELLRLQMPIEYIVDR